MGIVKYHHTLLRQGYKHTIKKTERLARAAGLQAICLEKKTSLANKQHAVHPYLLRNLQITRINQVWQVDITYIKMRVGLIYLVCLIDVLSRKIMGFHVSTLLDTDLCIEALESALQQDRPEIINSDQGSQFTSKLWINTLKENNIFISMDGKGRCIDNIYIERLWRSIKYEMVYLHRFDSVNQAKKTIHEYIKFYNNIRVHQALGYKTPQEIYQLNHNMPKEHHHAIINSEPRQHS